MSRVCVFGAARRSILIVSMLAVVVAGSPALAGLPVIDPPAGARVVDFDDVSPAPTSFNQTIALRTRYAAQGIVFSAPGSDGGAILDAAAGFSISGYSAPNFLAFNAAAGLQGGGQAKFPETLLFRQAIRYLQFNVADTSGFEITAEAFDKENNSLGSISINTASAMQTLVLEARHIAKVVITGGGLETAIDDVAFILDTQVIDFDDVLAAPINFSLTTAVRQEYVGNGVVFAGAQQDSGGAILNQGANITVTGFSPPNYLAFNSSATLINGATPELPQYIFFNPPVSYVRFLVGDFDESTVHVEARDSGGQVIDEVDVETGIAMKPVVLEGTRISGVFIASNGGKLVIDDLEYLIEGTLIDFDDDTNPPVIFNEATALRDRYAALGVRFRGTGNDGAALILANPTMGAVGYSGSNVLAVDAGDQLANGATPQFPETILFDTPMKQVELRISDSLGSRIFVEARDAAGAITATTDIFGTAAFQNVFLYFDGTTELRITSNGTRAVMDDLAFAPTDACTHDPCYQGSQLVRHCSACVTKICAENSDCCNDGWDESCALATDTVCELFCAPLCGDANSDRKVAAGDALEALRTAVGTDDCPKSLCDFNGDNKILSVDALLILKTGVGLETTPNCPPVL